MFILNVNTEIKSQIGSKPVLNAINIFKRDLEKACSLKRNLNNPGTIKLISDDSIAQESYRIQISDSVNIYASDDLGFVYGLLFMSEKYLKIKPFWFWMDQKICNSTGIPISPAIHEPPKYAVRFRGWFINDEVLISKWSVNGDMDEPWRMAFEALLRCGGNIVIPGTDKNSPKYRRMAADMGLWITHHHAEPLGAEMFARAYPNKVPNFMGNPTLFYKLWEDAVKAQKDYNVVWNLCFRGQGDKPFWSDDTSGRFDTPEARGALLSQIIEEQHSIIKKYTGNEKPVCCTNLYGEIMELYDKGFISLAPDIIKVYADNGYGKMVTRRRDGHSARVKSMPVTGGGSQGIYYHVSFYDLQAANHITMLSNSINFVNKELSEVLENDGGDMWVINCSNIRPHVYYLDAVRKKWLGMNVSDEVHSVGFTKDYLDHAIGSGSFCGDELAHALEVRPQYMLRFGEQEDERAGEQFFTENSRIIAHQIIVDRNNSARQLNWLTGECSLAEQIKKFSGICKEGLDGLREYMNICESASGGARQCRELFNSTVLMQARLYYYCAAACALLNDIYTAFTAEDYKKAFVLAGRSAELFDTAQNFMRSSEYGVWKGFYFNDCFADIKHSAYMMRKLMGFIREFGDNSRHDKWYRDTMYAPEDRNVMLLLVLDNHMTDWELYEAMKDTYSTI